jgi:hypothetical protein
MHFPGLRIPHVPAEAGRVRCHASDGNGIAGFNLATIKVRMNRDQLVAWIKNPLPPMPRIFPVGTPMLASEDAHGIRHGHNNRDRRTRRGGRACRGLFRRVAGQTLQAPRYLGDTVNKRAPLKTDPPGKCSRWHVVAYNQETKKLDWHTMRGTKDDAKSFKRKFESAKLNGDYTGPLQRKSFEEVAKLFLDDKRANSRRFSTLEEYQTELKFRLLPQTATTWAAQHPQHQARSHEGAFQRASKESMQRIASPDPTSLPHNPQALSTPPVTPKPT